MASVACNSPTDFLLRRTLQQTWGYNQVREPQQEIIRALLNRQDLLAILPTGGGKSLCFQLPAIVQPGLTLVVSPLLALMENQVRELQELGIATAALHSQLTSAQRRRVLRQLEQQRLSLLYVSPETLLSRPVWQQLIDPDLALNGLIIDEAHCVVQWGSNFRPAYQRLGAVRQALQAQRGSSVPLPVAAFTATADLPMQRLLVQTLQLDRPEIFQRNIYRPNLHLQVKTVWSPQQRRRSALRYVRSKGNQSGLVYGRTRRDCDALADWFNRKGLETVAYHGGLSDRQRRQIEQDWLNNRLKFVICTSAFGMGINKANVRWVLHYQVPLLLSEYVQEVGRGGRDGLRAEALALVSEPTGWLDPSDRQRDQYFLEQLAKHEHRAQKMLDKLPPMGSIAEVAKRFPQASAALALLHQQGKVRWVDPFYYALTPLSEGPLAIALRPQTLATTRNFVRDRHCRWQTLLQSFGCAPLAQDCGHCDVCL